MILNVLSFAVPVLRSVSIILESSEVNVISKELIDPLSQAGRIISQSADDATQ
jgi:hypothetical protein